jgi:two-component system phosphate regulon response regulator OmpR
MSASDSAAVIIPVMPQRVLIVDDDAVIRETTAEYLSDHGFEVALAADGAQMRAAFAGAGPDGFPDVVLLDLNLPGEDGLSLTRWLRAAHDVAIIMVTGAGEVVDRVVGLELGADDYLAKPFDLRELRARVNSVLRRTREPKEAAGAPAAGRRVKVGRCQLDLDTHLLVDGDGAEVPLTGMEFDLLRVFVEHANRVLTRDQLLTLTRNREWEPFDRSIDIRIARLRRKIEPDPAKPSAIREFMLDLLSDWGLEVAVLPDGAAARDAIAADPLAFDLLITDHTMPQVTGLELAREVARLRPGLPVILYTGYGEDLSPQELREAGVARLLRKPVEPAQFFPLLAAHLAAR